MSKIKDFLINIDNMSKEDIKLAKDFIKLGIKTKKEEIKDLKDEIKEIKKQDKKDSRIKELKEEINEIKTDLKQMKKALWSLRFVGVVKWFRTKWQQFKGFVAMVINKIKGFLFGTKEDNKTEKVNEPEVKIENKTDIVEKPKKETEEETETKKEIKAKIEEVKTNLEEKTKKEVIDIKKYASEDSIIKLTQYVAGNFKEINKNNPGFFRDSKEGSIEKANAKGNKKAKELILKGSIVMYLDGFVSEPKNIEKFINYVVKYSVKDFSKVKGY